MEKTCDYDICTGCGICSVICPKQCIEFKTENLGHILPKIDVSQCIDCKRCEKVCPAINKVEKNYPIGCNAAIIKNEKDYLSTTSGGAAQGISLYTLNQKGCVYGCAVQPGGRIEHVRVENIFELDKLKGSKYVQSRSWLVYKDLISQVDKGRLVTFIGTPCQCAAIKNLFKDQPENLLIVDLICHGVPSEKFLHYYLRRKRLNLDTIGNIKFRTQNGYQIEVIDINDSVTYSSIPLSKSKGDSYYGPFFYGLSYRKSCYSCDYARPERCSDITIGDFWGLGSLNPCDNIPNHEKGISVILANTVKGRSVVEELTSLMNLYDRSIEEAILGNDQLRSPMHRDWRVRTFDCLHHFVSINLAYKISSFDRIIKQLLKKFILRN